MALIKVNTKIEANIWEEFTALANESELNIEVLVTEAISEYIHKQNTRTVLDHLADSLDDNGDLGQLLTK